MQETSPCDGSLKEERIINTNNDDTKRNPRKSSVRANVSN